jgi:hypothetical protein
LDANNTLHPSRKTSPSQARLDEIARRHLGDIADDLARRRSPQDGIAPGQGAQGAEGIQGVGEASQVFAPEGDQPWREAPQAAFQVGQALSESRQTLGGAQGVQAAPGQVPAVTQGP